MSGSTLVLGIGNSLLSDEGAGIHALALMQSRYPHLRGVKYLDGGTLSFSLAAWIEQHDNLIVFDAADFDAAPGTVQCLTGADMDDYLGLTKRSAHEVGLIDLLDIARLTDALPHNRALIGIQPETFRWGLHPGEKVQQALPAAVDLAVQLVKQWQVTLSTNADSPKCTVASIC